MALKPIIQDVCDTVRHAVFNAISNALTNGTLTAPPAQVVVGWPTSTDLVQILAQEQYQITIYAMPDGKDTSRYPPTPFQIAAPSTTLTVAVSGNTATFSGPISGGLNIHTFVGAPLQDAFVQTITSDSYATIAAKVRDAINGLSIPGVSATSSTASFTVSGSASLECNIGNPGQMAVEVNRIQRGIQVSGWFPDPNMRFAVMEPIMESIGTTDAPFLTLSTGAPLRIQNGGRDNWNLDKNQSAYSCYEHHLTFDVEYGVLRLLSATQVESIKQIITVNDNLQVTTYTAGG